MATTAAPAPAPAPTTPSPDNATAYLNLLLGRTLRIHVTDSRIFVGQMKCTDKDRNIILALTHEYRPPSDAAIRAAIAESGDPSVRLPHGSRYVGLVVVPGRYVTKIECEESGWNPAPVLKGV